MIQGDIYLYKFKSPNKRRPVLILTKSVLIAGLKAISVAEITTTIRGNDAEVILDESDGLRELCAVNLVNIQTVQKNKLSGYITHLSADKMHEVRQAIEYTFGLEML